MISKESENKNYYWILYGLIVTLGIFFRFYLIGERPFHHDESLNAIYGRYFYAHPSTHFYKYDPMLHGPFLYNLYPFFYQILGATKSSARIVMALFGSFLIFVPFFFRSKISKNTLFLSTLFIASSPTLIYWSRFVRHDPPVLLCLAVCLIAWITKDTWKRSILWTWGLILPFTMKENAYVHIAILLGYLVYESLLTTIFKIEINSLASKAFKFIKANWGKVLIGITSAIFIYIVLYSAWFRHPEGILDGVYRKSLAYWLSQHHKDRIAGPFVYQFLILSWYEQVFILLAICQTLHFYMKRSFQVKGTFVVFLLLAFILKYLNPSTIPANSFLSTILKLKISLDFYPFLILLSHSIIMTTCYLFEKKQVLAFTGYLFTSFFFTYSLVGEKVPWLSLYPLVMGVLFLCVYYQKELNSKDFGKFGKVIILVFVCFQVRMMLMTNYSRAGADTEFISQVHTSDHYEKVALKIREEINYPIGQRPHVMAMEHNTWPLTWYLYGLKEYHYIQGKRELEDFDYILTSTTDTNTRNKLRLTHEKSDVPLRWWWVPDYKTMNLKNFFNYAFNHNPWTVPGKMDISIYKKKPIE
ncbi:MAG: TIGR03663 family protein [Bacteriovoracaceae bacterium]|nr:TIGR03663 family protein [Bacteriovoracaceae bacterium]